MSLFKNMPVICLLIFVVFFGVYWLFGGRAGSELYVTTNMLFFCMSMMDRH